MKSKEIMRRSGMCLAALMGVLTLVQTQAIAGGTESEAPQIVIASEPIVDPGTGKEIGFTITYPSSGILEQSLDLKDWTRVSDASTPGSYVVRTREGDSQKFYRIVLDGGDVDERDITLSLSDKVSLELIYIKPGTFVMGSPSNELGREEDELQHTVTLTRGYWLGKYELTQAQYQALIGENPSHTKGDQLPVEHILWNNATNFCAKLTAQERAAGRLPEGYEYTLPTEAQWEYACRAGTTTALNSGKNLTPEEDDCPNLNEVGWYWSNSEDSTREVGQKQPNAWGLYDMHGNVWEWCKDCCENPYGAGVIETNTYVEGVQDPLCKEGEYNVIRGGSYYSYANVCRSATRDASYPYNPYSNVGLRIALAPVQ